MASATTGYNTGRKDMRTIYILLLMTSYQRLEGVLDTQTTAVCKVAGESGIEVMGVRRRWMSWRAGGL